MSRPSWYGCGSIIAESARGYLPRRAPSPESGAIRDMCGVAFECTAICEP